MHKTIFAREYADSLAATTGCTICITDHDQVVAAAGIRKKELQEKFISKRLEMAMSDREQILAYKEDKKFVPVTSDGLEEFAAQVICPIIAEGDVLGSVVFVNREPRKVMGEVEKKLAMAAAGFLGRQIEQ